MGPSVLEAGEDKVYSSCGRFHGPCLEVASIHFLHIPLVTEHQGRLGDVASVCYGLNLTLPKRYFEIQTCSN